MCKSTKALLYYPIIPRCVRRYNDCTLNIHGNLLDFSVPAEHLEIIGAMSIIKRKCSNGSVSSLEYNRLEALNISVAKFAF